MSCKSCSFGGKTDPRCDACGTVFPVDTIILWGLCPDCLTHVDKLTLFWQYATNKKDGVPPGHLLTKTQLRLGLVLEKLGEAESELRSLGVKADILDGLVAVQKKIEKEING